MGNSMNLCIIQATMHAKLPAAEQAPPIWLPTQKVETLVDHLPSLLLPRRPALPLDIPASSPVLPVLDPIMQSSVLSASRSPSIGAAASTPYYVNPSAAFGSLFASSSGPMLSGPARGGQTRSHALAHQQSSPISPDSATRAFPFAPTVSGTIGVSAQEDDEEEDHFDDYVQGDLGYEDDNSSAMELQSAQSTALVDMIGNVASGSRSTHPSHFTDGPHAAERRDRQRISPSPSPLGSSYSSAHSRQQDPSHQHYRDAPGAMIANARAQGQQSTSVSSEASPTSVSASASAVVAAAEQILNSASYEGMNTRSYGLTILADGSNGSRAFMNPLTGTAREPHSSGSGAGTPRGTHSSSYAANVLPSVYAQYARGSLPGMDERGGSIDPGSLRSSPFHLPPSHLHTHQATAPAHLPHMHPHSTSAYVRGNGYATMSNRAATLGHDPHFSQTASPDLRQFTPKMGSFIDDPDMDEDILPTEDQPPSNAHSFAYGDPTLMPSPSASTSSGSGSGSLADGRLPSPGHDLPLAEIGLDALQQDDDADEEPLYVNAKQYHRILKRRAARARLEELNQLIRQRKVSRECGQE